MLRPLLGLALATLVLPACNPCAEQCRVEANKVEECLRDWGLEWADLDAEDRLDYRQGCVSEENLYEASLEGEGLQTYHQSCSAVVSDLRVASDCDEVWSALNAYGE